MRIVALSDTHGHHERVDVPDGDVFVFAGDFMTHGFSFGEIDSFRKWMQKLPHKHKLWIAGNHDRLLEMMPNIANEFTGCRYLLNKPVTIDDVVFWGSPITPFFNNWAFNLHGPQLNKHWSYIPLETDVLITHGPPKWKCDRLGMEYLGDAYLARRVKKVSPQVHIFGHIHNGYGTARDILIDYYNVSICNEQYQPVNPATIIELP